MKHVTHSIMFRCIVLLVSLCNSICAVSYGRVSHAQLIPTGSMSRWLHGQSSWSQCMCHALQNHSLPIIAFNSFATNQSCELFTNSSSPSAGYYLRNSTNSTVFVLEPTFFERIQCIRFTDTAQLMQQLQQTNTSRNITVDAPRSLALDTDLMHLIVIYNRSDGPTIQRRESTANMTIKDFSRVVTNGTFISYHQGLYYVGSNPPASLPANNFAIYNSSFNRVHNLTFVGGNFQRAVWLFNNTLMYVILRHGPNSSIAILNWHSSPADYTLNRTVPVPFESPYGLTKANDDSMIYVSNNSTMIYQMSTTTFEWSILVSNIDRAEKPMALTIDPCGYRLWVLMLGFGIRIYDRYSGMELASWNMSASYPTLYGMVLTSKYELYLIDFSKNQLIHYGSPITAQCPS